MWQFTVLYRKPDDPEGFERHYRDVHIPMTWKFPKMRRMTIAKPIPNAEGASDVWMISTMYWDDLASLREALESEARKEAWIDANSFRHFQIGRYVSEIQDV